MQYRPKRIVLCSDGTGNTVIKGRGSNVWKTFEAVDINGHRYDPSLREQIAFYDDGVGTEDNKLVKAIGGATGWGLSRNIREMYGMLCRAYGPGDEIYIFGFSRGAYTARCLAGLIVHCGIIDVSQNLNDAELGKLVKEAYRRFRKHFRKASDADAATTEFRETHARKDPDLKPDWKGRIKFVGVWDTVAAVGLPFKELTDVLNLVYPLKFPDNKLSPQVEKGCHAMAIDEQRETFFPELWDETDEKPDGFFRVVLGKTKAEVREALGEPGEICKDGDAEVWRYINRVHDIAAEVRFASSDEDAVVERTQQRIEQVWFAGVHSNVGGGYPKQGISLVPLDWMLTKAEEQGLRFIESERMRYRDLQNVHDKLYNSRAGVAIYYRYKPRHIARMCHAKGVIPKIHISAFERLALSTQGYAPGNLPKDFEVAEDPNTKPSEYSRELVGLAKIIGSTSMLLGSEPTEQSLLLDHVKGAMTLRRGAHFVFIVLTLTLIGTLIGDLTLPGWAKAAGLLVMVVLILLGLGARKRMRTYFSNAWRKAEFPET